jgi:hypothetical protein
MMEKLNVSKKWKYLCEHQTWIDIFEETVKNFPEKEALVFTESKRR